MDLFRKTTVKEEKKPAAVKKPAPAKPATGKKSARGETAFEQMLLSLGELSEEDAIKACTSMNPTVFKKEADAGRIERKADAGRL